ncbi:hypothetical protein AB0H07_05885 [Streptomyces sp. NPDC021354]|uniref:hypothetical protein n=1 Tax=Streptomyces sp. NPDC021354 TaxID=3154793 RepID=UPI0033DA2F1D
MNIGKTAALVTAAAGAVVFGGSGALAWDNPTQQINDCDSSSGVSISGSPGQSNCLNFAQIFGDPHGVVQQNDCDTSVGAAANVTVFAPVGGGEMGSECANIAVSSKSKAGHRGAFGAGLR